MQHGLDTDRSPLKASSRYPQIYKNWRSKTCQGLSIWVFVLLLIYNFNYIAVSAFIYGETVSRVRFTHGCAAFRKQSILIKSTTHSYLIVNLPWLVNSVYNIMLDFLVSVM